MYFLLGVMCITHIFAYYMRHREKDQLKLILASTSLQMRDDLIHEIGQVNFYPVVFRILSLSSHLEQRRIDSMLLDLDWLLEKKWISGVDVNQFTIFKTELIKLKQVVNREGRVNFFSRNPSHTFSEIIAMMHAMAAHLLSDKHKSLSGYLVVLFFVVMYYVLFKFLELFIDEMFGMTPVLFLVISIPGLLGYVGLWHYLSQKADHVVELGIINVVALVQSCFWADTIHRGIKNIGRDKIYWVCETCGNENSQDHFQCWRCNRQSSRPEASSQKPV